MAESLILEWGGVEFLHFALTGLPADAVSVEVSLDGGLTWHPATVVDAVARLLVAHPEAVDPDPSAVLAPLGLHTTKVRMPDDPENLVRPAGRLYVAERNG